MHSPTIEERTIGVEQNGCLGSLRYGLEMESGRRMDDQTIANYAQAIGTYGQTMGTNAQTICTHGQTTWALLSTAAPQEGGGMESEQRYHRDGVWIRALVDVQT